MSTTVVTLSNLHLFSVGCSQLQGAETETDLSTTEGPAAPARQGWPPCDASPRRLSLVVAEQLPAARGARFLRVSAEGAAASRSLFKARAATREGPRALDVSGQNWVTFLDGGDGRHHSGPPLELRSFVTALAMQGEVEGQPGCTAHVQPDIKINCVSILGSVLAHRWHRRCRGSQRSREKWTEGGPWGPPAFHIEGEGAACESGSPAWVCPVWPLWCRRDNRDGRRICFPYISFSKRIIIGNKA